MKLENSGFCVLSEFRSRLPEEEAVERLLLEKLLAGCKERGLLKARGKQRTDSLADELGLVVGRDALLSRANSAPLAGIG